MKEVFDRYSSKAPNPLNTQFADRVDKKTAIQKHKEKTQQKNTTSLFPSSAEQDRQQSTTVSAESVATSVRTAQKSRKCSKCKKTGHTKRTCQGT